MAVLAAYIEQQRTGKGQEVNVALMHAGMWSVGVPIVTAAYGDEYPTDRTPCCRWPVRTCAPTRRPSP